MEDLYRTPFYLITAHINWGLAIFQVTVAVFLFCQNVKPTKNKLQSAYFLILSIDCFVVALSNIGWFLGDFVRYNVNSPFTVFADLMQWYCGFFEGFCDFILACNRGTAFLVPTLYHKMWRGYPKLLIIISILVFPFFINGYTFFTNTHCRIYLYTMECYPMTQQITLQIAILTMCMSICSTVVTLLARFRTPKYTQKITRMSRFLLLHALVISILSLLSSGLFAYSTLTVVEHIIMWQNISQIFLVLQHFFCIAILFFMSPDFRRKFFEFYYLTFLVKKQPILTVSSKTDNPRHNIVISASHF